MLLRNFLLLTLVFFATGIGAQVCTNPGQNPGMALPVCGSSVFTQSTVEICGQKLIPTPCLANGSIFLDKNPYWYSFTCFAAGTLGFLITPNNLRDDYDWQLFDVTNHDPSDVYTDKSLFVACNWSGESGKTGASSQGNSLISCEGYGVSLFSKMPTLQLNHNYLLLVSHYDNTQSGYTLQFSGGTATLTDTTAGRLKEAKASCDGVRIGIKLNKKLKCSSLAADGSDFVVTNSSAVIAKASPVNCSNGFDMDSLVLTLNSPLPAGTYNVSIRKGSDANTLLDICDAAIPAGDSLFFSVFPSQPAALDSITKTACAPAELQLILNSAVVCNSISADGSDFTLTGPSPAVITGASGECNNGLTTVIKLTLSQPIYSGGTNIVTVKKGSDGNTIINECSLATADGSTVSFVTSDTVSAAFNFAVTYGCNGDSVSFFNNGDLGVTNWKWQFNTTDTSAVQNPAYVYKSFGLQQVRLTVSNKDCVDSSAASFTLDNELKADFSAPVQLCPQDAANFRDTSVGKILTWSWDFSNGNVSAAKNPPLQVYPVSLSNKLYPVRLIVTDNYGCHDTAYKQVKVLYNCYIAVPTAFTPNGDNLNDYLYPVNAWKAKNLVFKVYNRYGQLIFQTEDFSQKWDGTYKGAKQAPGTYIWVLRYTHEDTGQLVSLKGTTVLIR